MFFVCEPQRENALPSAVCRELAARALPHHLSGFCMFVAIASAVSGCGGGYDGPLLVETSGAVTFKGDSVEGATVIFLPSNTSGEARAVQAVTDDKGEFVLFTAVKNDSEFMPGAVAGPYSVQVSKRAVSPTGERLVPKNLLPGKYADARASPLRAEIVPDQKNHFDFELD